MDWAWVWALQPQEKLPVQKMGSCSLVPSHPDMKGPIYKQRSCIGDKQLLLSLSSIHIFYETPPNRFPWSPQAEVRIRDCTHPTPHLWHLSAVSHFGLFDGTPCGAKQAHINLPLVWIFRYSCLRHGDSSWCAWAPQISQCHAWTEAAASGPRQAQPAQAGPESPQIPAATPSTHGGQLNKHL